MNFDAITRREFIASAGLGVAAAMLPSFAASNKPAYALEESGTHPYRPYTLSPYDKGMMIEDAWPTIFFGDETIGEIKRKVAKLDWAKKAVARMVKEAEGVMLKGPQLPVERAGWRHDFYSRATGEHLLYDPDSCDKFLDPSTGKYEYDEAQRRAWALLTHERTFRMMRSVGVLYGVTGDERYASWIADGMRQAVEYFKHDEFMKGSALYFQALYDAAILMILANIFSLTKNSSAYSKQDVENIRVGIFEKDMGEMLDFLSKNPGGNMSCYVAGALACSGRVFERDDWTNAATGESSGARTLLTTSLYQDKEKKTDGLWHEGTMFYHFYSMCPLVTVREQAVKMNDPIIKDAALWSRFEEMFAAPVALVDERLRLPLIGDLGAPKVMNLAAYRHLYEYAAGQINFERFGPILAAIYERSKAMRGEMSALAFGPDSLPKPGGTPKKSTLLPCAEIGTFRCGSLQVLFRAGRYRGGHDHPDKLQITLSAFGQPISPDLGTPGYSILPIVQHYHRATVAHNTLFSDETHLKGTSVLEWRGDEENPRARASVVDEGVRYQRTVFFSPPYVVLLDEYSSDDDHRFGWAYHSYGKLSVASPTLEGGSKELLGMPALRSDGPFSMLTDRFSGATSGSIRGIWNVSRAIKLHLLSVADAPTEVTCCKSIGNPNTDNLDCLILRSPGKSLRIATVLEPSRVDSTLESVKFEDISVAVGLRGGGRRIYTWD
ncbi:MAG: hypothetical protein GX141_09060 [Armatimonadetes bacterium]|nr:hypothetical protein [Armatimonadota bacterium]